MTSANSIVKYKYEGRKLEVLFLFFMPHPEFAPAPDVIEQFVLDADINTLLCVDERQLSEGTPPNTVNGVEVPGAIYGIWDMIKALTGKSEAEA